MIEQVMDDGFRRRVEIRAAFDKRHSDPKQDYGIHGMDIRFALIGPMGATQFLVYTGLQLPHVFRELVHKPSADVLLAPMGADIGYHAHAARYDGQTPMECDLLGGQCYYDGSSLQADEFLPTFLGGGDEVVWTMLRKRYDELFTEPADVSR